MTGDLHLALIGKHLGHSYSKNYFQQKFAGEGMSASTYDLVELADLRGLRDMVDAEGLDGFNVTIPYKEAIIPLLDRLEPTAAAIGAVNTVRVLRRRCRNGEASLSGHRPTTLVGHNTDGPALLDTLRPLLKPHHREALILGTGGASKAAGWALSRLGIRHLFVSRQPDGKRDAISYAMAYHLAATHLLIVNATPVGMFPNADDTPWQHPELLGSRHLCFDLVYNPSPTLFLRQSAQQGATAVDGLAMLHRQADLAFELWIGGEASQLRQFDVVHWLG